MRPGGDISDEVQLWALAMFAIMLAAVIIIKVWG
jgi:hypothetical protein